MNKFIKLLDFYIQQYKNNKEIQILIENNHFSGAINLVNQEYNLNKKTLFFILNKMGEENNFNLDLIHILKEKKHEKYMKLFLKEMSKNIFPGWNPKISIGQDYERMIVETTNRNSICIEKESYIKYKNILNKYKNILDIFSNEILSHQKDRLEFKKELKQYLDACNKYTNSSAYTQLYPVFKKLIDIVDKTYSFKEESNLEKYKHVLTLSKYHLDLIQDIDGLYLNLKNINSLDFMDEKIYTIRMQEIINKYKVVPLEYLKSITDTNGQNAEKLLTKSLEDIKDIFDKKLKSLKIDTTRNSLQDLKVYSRYLNEMK